MAAGIVAGGLWLFGTCTPASAQFGPSVGAVEAQNQTGGGAAPAAGTVARAAGTVAAATQPTPAPAAPAAGGAAYAAMPPAGMPPGGGAAYAAMPPAGMPPGGGAAYAAMPPGTAAAAMPGVPAANLPPLPSMTVPVLDAMVGQKVIDAASYRRKPNDPLVLDDIRHIQIKESEKSKYSNDGKTLGSTVPNGIYCNIQPTSTNEYIGDISFFNLQRIDLLLQTAQAMDPLDFFGLTAETNERFSLVASMRDRIRQRDNKIMHVETSGGAFTGWANTFLRDYRTQQDNPNSPFFPQYVPRPPEPPALPTPPAPWKPMAGRNPALEAAIAAYLAGLAPTMDKATEDASIRQRLAADPAFQRTFITQYTPATPASGGAGGPGGQQPPRRGGGGGGGGGAVSGAVMPPGSR